MRRFSRIAVTALAILAAVIAGSAYWIGLELEQRLRAIPEIESFERGWFSSKAVSRLHATPMGLPPIILQHQIYHGVLPLHDWRPALAVIDTVAAELSPWCASINLLCQQPASVITRASLNGLSYNNIVLPKLQLTTADDNTLEIDGLQAQLQVPLFRGDSVTAKLALQRLRIALAGQAPLTVSELALLTVLTAADSDASAELELSVLDLSGAPLRIGSSSLKLQLRQLNNESVLELIRTWQRQPGLSPALMLAMQGFLQHQPELELRDLQLASEQGDLNGHGQLSLHAVNVLSLFSNPLRLINEASLEISIAQDLLVFLLRNNGIEDDRLQQWQDQGFIERKGNVYHCRVNIENGALLVNRQKVRTL